MHTNSGTGGILSTTKWISVILNDGVDPSSGVSIIPKDTVREAITAYAIETGTGVSDTLSIVGYGLGWFRTPIVDKSLFIMLGVSLALEASKLYWTQTPREKKDISSGDGGEDTYQVQGKVDLLLPIGEYTGTYFAADYGKTTFCSSKSSSKQAGGSESYCDSLLSNFERVDKAENRTRRALELFASTPRVWFSQIRMTRLSANVFSAKFITLFPSGFGVDIHPFTYEGEKGA
ncbi:beta-lactamase transpeptidase [Pyrrhoderma noxium]|uniref:Beta-lactamase transpeptidase n=1 Tax=Pyrrhoderma noxium TaxID=2282107 RepID=A0A286UKY0_9AGAM|nr:beta-lactamase transpeptidase [Pyrrhoderma noxium]